MENGGNREAQDSFKRGGKDRKETANSARLDWEPGDTVYIAAGLWHQHHVTSDEPAMVLAIKPIPLQEYLGELNIVYKGDSPAISHEYKPGSFKEEFGRLGAKTTVRQLEGMSACFPGL